MKRVAFASSLLVGLVAGLMMILGMTQVNAAQSQLIFITAPSVVDVKGHFLDDNLATDLAPTGSIGKLLYLNKAVRWEVDPALIEEVQLMSKGYTLIDGTPGLGQEVATAFLARISSLAGIGAVDAMVYANPSEYWVLHLTPHERNYLFTVSTTRLATLLHQNVGAATEYVSKEYFHLSRMNEIDIRDGYNIIQRSAIYMAPADLDTTRLSLIRLFNRQMSSTHRDALLIDLSESLSLLNTKIRLAPGRFTITSSSQKLPITVINDFPGSAKINLVINSLNEKIIVGETDEVLLAGKSKVQVMVPIKVLTSGASSFSVVMHNSKGDQIGDPQIYPLSLKVISPVATWITTGAAITLFFAALLQSLRRIRRRQKG